jgi:hypothetical protein
MVKIKIFSACFFSLMYKGALGVGAEAKMIIVASILVVQTSCDAR